MAKPKFRSAYDGQGYKNPMTFLDENGEPEKSLTEQCHKDMCDVNNIIRKYDKTGLLEHVNEHQAYYGDYTEVDEYREALNKVITAQNMFDELPSDLRRRFGNDPGQYFEFVSNPENRDEMVRLGMMNPPEENTAPVGGSVSPEPGTTSPQQ